MSNPSSTPSYVRLAESGELARRAEAAVSGLAACRLCPRRCGVNRLAGEKGCCGIGRKARVSSAFPHLGEEDCLRGWRGSGTVFFAGCNLRCVFCQNYDISHENQGSDVSPEQLAALMLKLQAAGCHNINWVTPSHVVPQILEALALAVPAGLRLPLVYNSGGLDSVETLQWLDGVVDIYMPDFKYWNPDAAQKYLTFRDYPAVARAAVTEMHRQVGDLVLDSKGLARRGLLVRHLVMPDAQDDTREIMRFLAALSKETYVNIMAQYHPDGDVNRARFPELNRGITMQELRAAYQVAREAGLHRFDERRPFLEIAAW